MPAPPPVNGDAVVVIEDDDHIAEPVIEGLTQAGFTAYRASTGVGGLELAPDADLVLLDLGLPDLDGVEVCRRLRERSEVPIIVMTARADELDRVLLLELGADDYVVKPFGLRELVARVRAVLRRTTATAGGAQVLGPLRIDRRARRVTVNDEEVVLSRKEFDLLAALTEDPGAVLRREDLIARVWDEHWWGPTKTLDVHVASLRKKLGRPEWVATVRGVGYRFETGES
ncbi:MAG TPA: response regulator transcription factor [Acidimicrobiales bacterium]|nr:response regulator transcription factor [Acidimicrobiales bacterium]